jgi:hypothetical protein
LRNLVPAIWLPAFELRREREISRWRLHLVKHRSTLKNRVHSTLITLQLVGDRRDVSDAVDDRAPAMTGRAPAARTVITDKPQAGVRNARAVRVQALSRDPAVPWNTKTGAPAGSRTSS